MEKILTEVMFTVFGIMISIVGYFVKRAFGRIDEHSKAIEEIRINCQSCNVRLSDEIIDRMCKILDEKLDGWWALVENKLMKEGRLPTRGRKKENV